MGKGTVGGLTFGKGSSVVFLLVVFSTALVVSLGAIAVAASRRARQAAATAPLVDPLAERIIEQRRADADAEAPSRSTTRV